VTDRGMLAAIVGLYVAAGVALCVLYRDGYSQDAALHYLLARDAGTRPATFVEMWPRPGFTLLYFLPSQLGYLPAKIFTVLLTATAAWQTVAAARALGLERPWLAAPFLLASPVLFLLSTETMTEPLFVLTLALALRLRFEGRVSLALAVASLLPTLRPEGFPIGLVWGVVEIASEPRRFQRVLWLCLGSLAWIAACWILTRDPLYVLHTWPWRTRSAPSPQSAWWLLRYLAVLPLAVNPFLLPFAIVGAALAWRDRRRLPILIALTPLVVHTVVSWLDLVFDAGSRSRFLATVAPATALLTLRGWNATRRFPLPATAALFLLAFGFAFGAVDLSPTNRDWKAFRSALRDQERPERLVASQLYPYAELDRSPGELSLLRGDRRGNLEKIREYRTGTLVVWDRIFGPWYFLIEAHDFEIAGFRLLKREEHDLRPLVPWPGFLQDWTGRRHQTVWVFLKAPNK